MNCNMFWHFLYSKSFPMIQAAQSSEERERKKLHWHEIDGLTKLHASCHWHLLLSSIDFWSNLEAKPQFLVRQLGWSDHNFECNWNLPCVICKRTPKNFLKWNRSYQQHIDDTYMSCSTVAYSSLPSQSDGLLKDFHLLQYTFGSPNLGDTKCCRIKNILPHCLLRNTI